jgi:hypothetical protein
MPMEAILQARTPFEHVSQQILQVPRDLRQLPQSFACPFFIPIHQRPYKLSHNYALFLNGHIFGWGVIITIFIVVRVHQQALALESIESS